MSYWVHLLGNSLLRIAGLSCSISRFKRKSNVLSIVILSLKQERVTPPRQEGARYVVSAVSLQVFLTPVCFSMTFAYSSSALGRQDVTRALSHSRHRTVTSGSNNMRRPCTMRSLMGFSCLLRSLNWLTILLLTSSLSEAKTSCRALIFSRRCLLIAVDFAIAYSVS